MASTYRWGLRWLWVLALALGVSTSSPHPHIVIILADDLGWDDVSLHGSSQVPTPNIDTLAADGILLNNYYVQQLCTPSRSALMTGRYPIHLGLQHFVIAPSQPFGLGLNETTLPQYLKELGYTSHLVGKWHLGMFAEQYTPIHRGFDSHYGFYHGRGSYLDHTNVALIGLSELGLDFWRNGKVDRTAFGQYSTEIFTTEAEQIIADHDPNKPLFLYMAQQAAHEGNPGTPDRLYAPWKYMQRFSHIQNPSRQKMAGMISALDDSVGNVTRALHAKGMLNNTIIVFSTDNGAPANRMQQEYTTASNYPLRGCKQTLWEGGVRGTAFIWSPLLRTSGYVSHNLMHISDWVPTLLHAAGYNMSKLPQNLDSHSHWRALSGKTSGPRSELLINIDPIYQDKALRVGHMKVILGKGPNRNLMGWYKPFSLSSYDAQDMETEDYPTEQRINDKVAPPSELFNTDLPDILRVLGRPVKTSHLPYEVQCGHIPANVTTNCAPWKTPCLYNITADPCEYHNLAAQQPELLHTLLQRLAKHEATAVPPRNKPEDPAAYPSKHGGVWVPWIKLDSAETLHF